MGYQALLFCAEEKLARVVTQVFTELEFNIELVNEPFSAVKKLMAQHYDAIVVDCENDQNASLIFKSGRNSTSNQNSLALALVEGQAGVAKAYRIGANLVLTKPINVEQAKGTLRVARGLLRKNADAGAARAASTAPVMPASNTATASAARESNFAAASAKESKATFMSQSDEIPVGEVLPHAVLSSAPAVPEVEAVAPTMTASAKAEEPAAAVPEAKAESFIVKETLTRSDHPAQAPKPTPVSPERKSGVTFANLQGAAAAPAPAKEAPAAEKPRAKESELFETAAKKTQPAEVVGAPTFSALDEPASEGSGNFKKILAIAAIAVVAFGLGYFGWTKFGSKDVPAQSQGAVQSSQAAQSTPAAASAGVTQAPAVTTAPQNAASAMPQASKPSAVASSTPVTQIKVGAEDTKSDVVTRTFEPAPIRVKMQAAAKGQKQAEEGPAPVLDPLGVGGSKDSNLASLISGSARLPAAPSVSTLRISQGVSQGLLIKKVQPVYPANAKSMRLEGPVDMEAVIDREGKITNLKVLKGQPVLAHAAMEAVRQWRYKPYYLDGEPVEIQTQITVLFKLPN
jgi:periplasmic protein TonB